MSIAEIKISLIDKITHLDNLQALEEILNYLSDIEKGKKGINLSGHYDAIKSQYNDTLKKLAQ